VGARAEVRSGPTCLLVLLAFYECFAVFFSIFHLSDTNSATLIKVLNVN
jgi:hypothetical protein